MIKNFQNFYFFQYNKIQEKNRRYFCSAVIKNIGFEEQKKKSRERRRRMRE